MDNLVRKSVLFLILILLPLTLTGCWDNKDIVERGFVSAIGIDKSGKDKIQVTLQIIRPDIIRSLSNGGTSTGEDAYWVYTSEGETIFEAIRNQLRVVNRKPYFSHMQLIVIGEALARDDITDTLDLFERDTELRLTPHVLIAKGTTAKAILQGKSELESIPAMHLTSAIENNESIGDVVKVNIMEILRKVKFTGYNAAIGAIEAIQHPPLKIEDMEVSGAGVFKDDQLIGWLAPLETRGYNFTQNKVVSTIIVVPNPLSRKKKVSIEQVKVDATLDVEFKDDQLTLVVKVKSTGSLAGQQGAGDLTTEAMLKILEEEGAKVITKDIENVLKKAQKIYKSDFFGFCSIVHRKNPDYWHSVENTWDDIFCKSKTEITVDLSIKRTGLITNQVKTK